MPNPKLGSVTMDVPGAVKAAKGGQVEFRVEKAGLIHAGIGKASFSEDQILANVRAFIDAVMKAKPTGVKGRSEEHTYELQSLVRISYAVICLNKKTKQIKSLIIHTVEKNRHTEINKTRYK